MALKVVLTNGTICANMSMNSSSNSHDQAQQDEQRIVLGVIDNID